MRDICDNDLKVGAVLYLDGCLDLKRVIVCFLHDGEKVVFDNDCWNDVEEVKKRYKIND